MGQLFFAGLSSYVKSKLDVHGQGFQFIQEHGVHRASKSVREALTIRSQAAKSRERTRREKSQANSGSHTIKANNPIINLPYTDSTQDSGSTTFPLGERIAPQSKETFQFGDPELYLASLLRTVKLWSGSVDGNINRDEGEAEAQLFLFRGRLLRTVQTPPRFAIFATRCYTCWYCMFDSSRGDVSRIFFKLNDLALSNINIRV